MIDQIVQIIGAGILTIIVMSLLILGVHKFIEIFREEWKNR